MSYSFLTFFSLCVYSFCARAVTAFLPGARVGEARRPARSMRVGLRLGALDSAHLSFPWGLSEVHVCLFCGSRFPAPQVGWGLGGCLPLGMGKVGGPRPLVPPWATLG